MAAEPRLLNWLAILFFGTAIRYVYIAQLYTSSTDGSAKNTCIAAKTVLIGAGANLRDYCNT